MSTILHHHPPYFIRTTRLNPSSCLVSFLLLPLSFDPSTNHDVEDDEKQRVFSVIFSRRVPILHF